ncbi:MAG: UrcA family protein [Sphingomonas sp.]|nr:UrcA family protein [Sphingomonas sp.]
MPKILSAALGAIGLLTGAPALAHDSAVTVRVTDLNMSDPHDAAKLRHRIASAMEQVCGSYATVERADEDIVTSCRRAARAELEHQLAVRRIAGQQLARH